MNNFRWLICNVYVCKRHIIIANEYLIIVHEISEGATKNRLVTPYSYICSEIDFLWSFRGRS